MPAPKQTGRAVNPLLTATGIIGVALLFCWPAIYNGFPLVYGDTASYLDTVDPRKTMWARQIFYTGILRLLHWHISLWPAIFAQSLVTAHLLYLTVRALRPAPWLGSYLAVAAVLALATSLPWHTSVLLPDFFTAIVVLGLFLLAFCRARLSRLEIAYLAGLTTVAIVAHLSHIPLALGLIVVIALARLVLRWHERHRLVTALLLVLPVFAAATAHLSVNYAAYQSFSLSPASSIWLLARFIGDGQARAYLRDECPQRAFVLCAYLDKLPSDSDEFLWGDNSYDPIFGQAGGYPKLREEAREIVSGTLLAYPGWIARSFIANTAREFVDVGTGGWINLPPEMLNRAIAQYIAYQFPRDYPAFIHSPQANGRIPTSALATWHSGVIIVAAVACCIFLVIAARRRQQLFVAFCALILAALIGNAMVTGGLSGVHDRYQTRVAWLIVLAASIGATTCFHRMRLTLGAGALQQPFADYSPVE